MTSDRDLLLEGVHNFRDYGGYPVRGGGRLKRGILWRSAQHHGASRADLEKIAALGLVTVFDLRTSRERDARPCRRPDGFAARVFLGDEPQSGQAEGSGHAPHVSVALTQPGTADEMRDRMRNIYGTIAFRPGLQEMMRRHLEALAAGEGPSLINCAAGKDRTGIAVAVAMLAAGVHRDDVVDDYLLTNTAGDSEARIATGIAVVKSFSKLDDPDALRVLMSVEAQYLERAFTAIEDRYGSTEGYLREALGLDDAARERLREALVES